MSEVEKMPPTTEATVRVPGQGTQTFRLSSKEKANQIVRLIKATASMNGRQMRAVNVLIKRLADEDMLQHVDEVIEVFKSGDSVPWREAMADHMNETSEAATVLRGARLKEGMTQEKLADELGIEQSHISEMENGKRPIGKNMAKKLGRVLNIHYKVFL